jgi:hypothetical protein
MSETTNLGAAGPALAAHSKDGSVHGPTPVQATTGTQGQAQQAYCLAVDPVRDFATDNPVGLLLAAAGIELVLGFDRSA